MRLLRALGLAVVGTLAACGGHSPAVRSIHALLLPDCAVDDVQRIELEALDDGATRPESFAAVDPRAASDLVALPPAARIILARGRSKDGSLVSLGVLRADVDGGPAVGALFRDGRSCGIPLPDGSEARFPAFVAPAIASDDRGALLAGGHGEDGAARADAIFLDALRTEATRTTGMLRRRDEAIALALGTTFIVAGGHDADRFWSDLEVLDATVRPPAFDRRTPPVLSEARVQSAGVVLMSGDALLLGGRGADGKAVRTMEVIDAKTLTTRIVDVASLIRPRRAPRAVRLATGEVAVVGGLDAGGAPVADVEIISADAQFVRAIPFGASAELDAIPLPSGALLVAARDSAKGSVDLSLVRVDGTVEALSSSSSALLPPRWVPATDGAPFLWDGEFRRFDPWNGTLVDAALPSTLVPPSETDPFAAGLGVVGVARISGPDLLFFASRYDVRTELTSDETLGLGSTVHLSPDRHDGITVNRAGLDLVGGARVAITDVTFGAFTLRLGGGGRELPNVELRGERGALIARIGEGAPAGCAWPTVAGDSAELARDAAGAIVLRIGSVTQSCSASVSAEIPRVSLTLVAAPSGASIHGILVSRG